MHTRLYCGTVQGFRTPQNLDRGLAEQSALACTHGRLFLFCRVSASFMVFCVCAETRGWWVMSECHARREENSLGKHTSKWESCSTWQMLLSLIRSSGWRSRELHGNQVFVHNMVSGQFDSLLNSIVKILQKHYEEPSKHFRIKQDFIDNLHSIGTLGSSWMQSKINRIFLGSSVPELSKKPFCVFVWSIKVDLGSKIKLNEFRCSTLLQTR